MTSPLPRWVEIGLIPLINLTLAFLVAGVVVALIGEDPVRAMTVMINGAFVYPGSLGYTLYYTTNFIFTGLAVAVAFHAMLFNIGGEGQATLGGLGVALVCLWLDPYLPGIVVIPVAILGAALFGAAWAFVPGWLQAYRGSHIVITTIMFNFIAAGVLVALLSGVMMSSGQGSPQTRAFADTATMPRFDEMAAWFGIKIARSPLNISFVLALLACVGVWILIWRTKFGYAVRALGHSEPAAVYAGIPVKRMVVIIMAISGALAGLMAVNEILGAQEKLVLNFSGGYGFTGIAVALMGRNHPIGIVLASLLFGALWQGGAELDFEFDSIRREMVLVIQGLIILFSGALAYMFTPWLARLFLARRSTDG
ncbi:MAG: ABC transporter permease [Pseudomonadota bacterium]